MMNSQDMAASFMSLSKEEKKERILSLNNIIAKEMYNRYSTYIEINKQLQEKYHMNYEEFQNNPRMEIDLDAGEYERAYELWEMAQAGIKTLSGSLSTMMKQNSINN